MENPNSLKNLILSSAYPLHPWRKGRNHKTYYAISPATEDMLAQPLPINFTTSYVDSHFPLMIVLLMGALAGLFFFGGLVQATHGQVMNSTDAILANMAEYGINTTYVLLRQQYHRLLTFALFHINLLHLMSNLVGLWLIGRRIEPPFGRRRMVLLIFFSTLFSGLLWVLLSSSSFQFSIGASVIVYALIGAALMHIIVNRHVLGTEYRHHSRNLLTIIGLLVGTDLASAAVGAGGQQIDFLGHGLGFVSGMFVAWFIAPRMKVTLLGIYGMKIQARVDDINPFQLRSVFILISVSSLGFVAMLILQRMRWPSIFG